MEEGSNLRIAFRDIARGFSESRAFSFPVYIKHLSAIDIIDSENLHAIYLKEAADDGMPRTKEVELRLFQEGQWKRSDEDTIAAKISEIELLKKSIKTLFKPSEKDRVHAQVKDKEKQLTDLRNKKAELVGRTAETVADQKMYDYILRSSFFTDKKLTKPLYTEESFDEIAESDLKTVYTEFRAFSDLINEESVKKIVTAPFFNGYYAFLEHPTDFYGKSAVELSSIQMTLFIFAKIAKSIIDRNEHMPDEVRKDFDAILDYDDTKQKAEKMAPDTGHQHQVIFGANKKDMKYLGGDAEGNVAKRTLKALSDKGGSLTMAEMAKIHNKVG